jgi:mono/diheme cytochrome c family protein
MPRFVIWLGVIGAALTLLPLGWLAVSRTTDSNTPRIQVVPDMDDQPRHLSQTSSAFFADGFAARQPVEGTVARDESPVLGPRDTGKVGEAWITGFPVEVDLALVQRGRDRYDIFCAPCHGLAGRGDGPVARRASERGEAAWVAPTDITSETVVAKPTGELYGVIRDGIRNMPGYAAQVPTEDRWAIVAYVRALQRSVRGDLDDVPAGERPALTGGR